MTRITKSQLGVQHSTILRRIYHGDNIQAQMISIPDGKGYSKAANGYEWKSDRSSVNEVDLDYLDRNNLITYKDEKLSLTPAGREIVNQLM